MILSRVPTLKHDATVASSSAAELPMNHDAFAGFYERSARSLWAYLARASGDPTLADDLTQESFVRFLCADFAQTRPEEGEVAHRKYLFRIGTNLLRDHWRRPRAASIDEVPEEMFSVGDRTGVADSHAMLARALDGMRPRDRQLLWLAYAEDYSHKEIAEITGLGATSIRLLLFRARRTMAERLK
jgi:RNA polymerase sigma-70 factor (ECF subfamily)